MDMLDGQRVKKCRVVLVGCMGVPRYRMARWKSSLTGISCGGHLRFVGDICGELIWFHRCEAPRQDSRLVAGQVSDEPWSGPAIRWSLAVNFR